MSARLNAEYKKILTEPPNGITAGMAKNNISEWIATIVGPTGTPYVGALYTLNITFPKNYPFAPPKIKFETPIYHCNINEQGDICMDILKNAWMPTLTIEKVLLSISSLLADPNPDDPLDPDIAYLYKTNKLEHDRIARRMTIKYAGNI